MAKPTKSSTASANSRRPRWKVFSGPAPEFRPSSYYIVVDGLPIVRIDLAGWSRQVEATGITAKIENALAFQAAKSSVDIDAIFDILRDSKAQPSSATTELAPPGRPRLLVPSN